MGAADGWSLFGPAHKRGLQASIRLVSRNSGIRWNHHWVCVTHTLAGEDVGLEEVDDGRWDVYFGPLKLGRMNERILRIEDHKLSCRPLTGSRRRY